MLLFLQKIVLSALALGILAACSSSDEKPEKGQIEQATDKIAQETVSSIKTTLDKAQMAKELTEQHNSAVEKTSKPAE